MFRKRILIEYNRMSNNIKLLCNIVITDRYPVNNFETLHLYVFVLIPIIDTDQTVSTTSQSVYNIYRNWSYIVKIFSVSQLLFACQKLKNLDISSPA
jgi:hypothetical protein